jgi:hypothetical protein
VIERRVELDSADFSILSFEALDDLLLSWSVMIEIEIESEDELLRLVLNLGSGYRSLVKHIELGFLSGEGLSLLADHFGIPPESVSEWAADLIAHPLSSAGPLGSVIVSDFPEIFAEFRGKRFESLWRGSRDGFGAETFHIRCDGHANTLTVILDTDGNIFGGFTPLTWESRVWNGKSGDENNYLKADENQKSFIFTLKNPHNVAARRFALKAEKKYLAIYCDSDWGPCFPGGILVLNNCDTQADSYASYFGAVYINDTGLGGEPPNNTFLTGSEYFRVKEIEVFEITD